MPFSTAISFLRNQEITVLVALAVVVGGVWVFIEIADEVAEQTTQRFDERAVRAMRRADDPATPIGPRWLHEMGRDVTALGGVFVLAIVTLAVAGFLVIRGQYRGALFVFGAVAGGLIIAGIFKATFARPRPSVVPHLSIVETSSFPSGHSMMSAIVYLTLFALLTRFIAERSVRLYLLGVATALTCMVGVSRVYMGVHYPTDVLGGWTAGLTWATICWLGARALQRKHRLEPPKAEI